MNLSVLKFKNLHTADKRPFW